MTFEIGIDADGVLVQFHEPALEAIKLITGKQYTLEDITEFDFSNLVPESLREDFWTHMKHHMPKMCRHMKPFDGAVEAIKEIRAITRPKVELYVVTAPFGSYPNWAQEREDNLLHHFGFTTDHIISTKAKHMFAGKMLIDDLPRNIENWASRHPAATPVLWEQPHNRAYNIPGDIAYKTARIKDWSSLINLIKAHA
jgi:5'(3')-deoxyribonucleotidase